MNMEEVLQMFADEQNWKAMSFGKTYSPSVWVRVEKPWELAQQVLEKLDQEKIEMNKQSVMEPVLKSMTPLPNNDMAFVFSLFDREADLLNEHLVGLHDRLKPLLGHSFEKPMEADTPSVRHRLCPMAEEFEKVFDKLLVSFKIIEELEERLQV